MTKKLIISVCAIVAFMTATYLIFKANESTENPLTSASNLNKTTSQQEIQLPSPVKNTDDYLNEEINIEQKNNTSIIKQQSNLDKFLASNAFNTPSDFDNAFISADDIISQSTLHTVIAAEDFSRIINKMNSLDKDHTSLERESLLYKKFSDLIGQKFYAENYACSGKICLIEFNYDDSETSEEQLHQIRGFSKNHSFSNFSSSANDDMIYRGIYIATDDPSKMTLSRR